MMTLGRYELSRRVAHAAFDMKHTDKKLTDIAGEYGFDTYDTFSRAFLRETGVVPSLFRNRISMWAAKSWLQAPMAQPYGLTGKTYLKAAIWRWKK
jgi:AraC-like DNA-binding protein